MDNERPLTRKEFIKAGSILGSGLLLPGLAAGGHPAIARSLPPGTTLKRTGESGELNRLGRKPRVALLTTIYRNRSHADVIGTKLFTAIPTDEAVLEPRVEIVSVWIDQIGENDTGVRIAGMNGLQVSPTIADALTQGGDELAVDAVLYIGEHGDYPFNALGQKLYPRMNHLEQVFRTFEATGQSVPVFNDKHLSYNWRDCRWIHDRSRELGATMMAGSSLPFCWRDPDLVHPIDCDLHEAVAFGYAGTDAYGFHVSEILQCMVERRRGGETGVASVRGLRGRRVWEAMDRGEISEELVMAGLDAIRDRNPGNPRELVSDPRAIVVDYRDGTRGTVMLLDEAVNSSWAYAAHVDDSLQATEFVLSPEHIFAHFSYLTLNIEEFFLTGRPQAPVERTLLTSSFLDVGIRSMMAENGRELETPFLDVSYRVDGIEPIRPSTPRPTGSSVGDWPPEGYEFIMPEGWSRQ